jgi:CheY-like chemotaxis protein
VANESSNGPLKELATSRARFLAELAERIGTVRQGLGRIGASAELGTELNAVRRRLHALAAAAEVLHFTAAADALGRAENELAALAGAPSAAPARERVARILDLVPSLALGAAVDVALDIDAERTRSPRDPSCVVVFGDASLEAALQRPGPLHGAEIHVTRDLDQLLTLVTRYGPDVLVLDGDDPGVIELLSRVRQAVGQGPVPVVAVGSFDAHEGLQRLVRRGVSRVLPKPVDAGALQRTLLRLVPRESISGPRPSAFEGLGSEGLAEVIASEARQAFAEPVSGGSAASTPAVATESRNLAVAALWSAFARIRLLAARSAEAPPRFAAEGPYGMIPLAPSFVDGKLPAANGNVAELLAGRRFVVADGDPTLLGALSRMLQRLGASVLPARDGAQALELCERHWPDALIADALLPIMDGFELCRRARDDVALADMPVALVCWKEHLLEHARRLSEQHNAERPLDPASLAPLAEALVRRASLERRLERHDAVHGRIDGLTPRLLVQLTCSRTPSALLRVRTGKLAVEVAVVDGRPIHARLLEAGVVAAEGPLALGPLLGMRVGRFSVEALAEAPPAHFSGDVMTVLAPAIARSRRARSWLASAGIGDLGNVELEPRVAAVYLEDAPAGQKALLARLLRGESLRALLDTPEAGDGAQIAATLLELVRRGGLTKLVDRNDDDVLLPDAARLSPAARTSRSSGEAPAVVLPAAMTLAEAVLQAVSGGPDAHERPSARRTHPGLAPPTSLVESSVQRSAPRKPSLSDPGSDGTGASARPMRGAPLPTGPTEVAETWSSEPEEDADLDAASAPGAELDEVAVPATLQTRIRGVVSPLLVTLGAAALAFAGMRVIMGGALERWGVAPATEVLGDMPNPVDAGHAIEPAPRTPILAPSEAGPSPAEPTDAAAPSGDVSSAPSPGDPSSAAREARAIPLDVDVSTEIVDAPAEPALRPGHGLLEVRTWEPQRIYVDGVFMGNYAARLIPLSPGDYRIRLFDGAREIEQTAHVEAGRRTRLWARTKSPK